MIGEADKCHWWRNLVVLNTVVLLLTGCAGSLSGSSYQHSQARGEMMVRFGTVDAVRNVRIEGTNQNVGTVSGAMLGSLAGSNVGKGRGQVAGTILGAVAGGVGGTALESYLTRKDGLEITIKLDDGSFIAVTQEADEPFRPGDRVRVLSSAGTTRVSR